MSSSWHCSFVLVILVFIEMYLFSYSPSLPPSPLPLYECVFMCVLVFAMVPV